MRVLLLSDSSSAHTEKWALGLAENGIHIGLFSFNKAAYEWYNHPNITVFFEPDTRINAESTLTKLAYIKYVSILKRIIRHFKPDVLHAHYATSYGLVGALSGFKPFVLSVWGSDVYDFPTRSKLHRRILQYNLKKAALLMSTSKVMAEELKKYTNKAVLVTPFGVNVNEFSKKVIPDKDKNVTHIGSIKSLEEKYGIEYIIEAVKILLDRRPGLGLKVHLVGGGGETENYKKLINDYKLDSHFVVPGRIPFSEMSAYHNLLDIFLNVSIDDSESFGVACVEAMACEKPVIVSDVGGLMEVVNNGEFGLVIPKKNALAMANAIEQLIDDPAKAITLGEKARQHVLAHYNWENNLKIVMNAYTKLLDETRAHEDQIKTKH